MRAGLLDRGKKSTSDHTAGEKPGKGQREPRRPLYGIRVAMMTRITMRDGL